MSSGSVDLLEALINATGSLLSILGAGFIIICYIILPTRKHIRHAFILNLTIADFINAVNNSTSGLIVLTTNKNLVDSSTCTANGFIGQMSVQAVDCSILAITVVTWWTLTSQKSTAYLPLSRIIPICGTVWILPLITSLTALFKGYYGPTSTSWCWIKADPTYLRYVFAHGWRFIIIFFTSGLCIYIQIYLRKHILGAVHEGCYVTSQEHDTEVLSLHDIAKKSFNRKPDEEDEEDEDDEEMIPRVQTGEQSQLGCKLFPTLSYLAFQANITYADPRQSPRNNSTTTPHSTFARPARKTKSPRVKAAEKRARGVRKTMLLNAYPILYIILWIPGIANRIAEATNNPLYVLRILQSATQFIGLANAITFGWNEQIWRYLKARFIAKYGGGGKRRWAID